MFSIRPKLNKLRVLGAMPPSAQGSLLLKPALKVLAANQDKRAQAICLRGHFPGTQASDLHGLSSLFDGQSAGIHHNHLP